MKYLILLLLGFLVNGSSTKEPSYSIETTNALEGAWEMVSMNGQKISHRAVLLIEEPYAFYTEFDVENKEFVGSQGGTIEIIANKVFYTMEFNTWSDEQIGEQIQMTAELKANEVTLMYNYDAGTSNKMILNRIDDGNSDLAGAWRITDRMRNGEMQAMQLGARKTIKMITGSRFQWAAFNPETKQFSGTGGGKVTLKDGKYSEHIEFFSRNPDRVGADLTFNYEVNGDKWTHSGLSSSGDPIKEIWTRQ
ncbi:MULTISPECIES: hypothetical protein [Roseivirga]|jgi:hypothetical protein|uniref:Membrane or secreted protein n=1 Tax=Roseivirga spongicola TaxID=333140 RepID=A0A150XIE0_9BACT|nr:MULTISPECIES: hypothetical protein [Roseivirga]PWL31188.1 MAG: membrane or secreted protein [Roseivirga sp. XM-24bin3]KYG78452.1 hypothetical protein AWW68_06700 [Roseivirga spongicola]MBO6496058.1 membrane or secreted protein [Roseivirga sp.]MBO6660724.1 membrane or secreted protein [Roseivirga sp.]MBO6909292.1 membrane or secreted protein [Roseivirga sp.]